MSNQEKEEIFSDILDVYKHLSDVKIRGLDEDISSAYVMAKLNDKDKELVREMVSNAYYSKDLIESVVRKCDTYGYKLTKEEREYLLLKAKKVFDKYMRRINMIVTLNRNVEGNYMVNVLSNYKKEEMEKLKEQNNTTTPVLADELNKSDKKEKK